MQFMAKILGRSHPAAAGAGLRDVIPTTHVTRAVPAQFKAPSTVLLPKPRDVIPTTHVTRVVSAQVETPTTVLLPKLRDLIPTTHVTRTVPAQVEAPTTVMGIDP